MRPKNRMPPWIALAILAEAGVLTTTRREPTYSLDGERIELDALMRRATGPDADLGLEGGEFVDVGAVIAGDLREVVTRSGHVIRRDEP